ncbi:MAG: B12-binding domain-containing radical SAM protein, partial [Selenomonadaceae bacterium]
MIKLEPALLQAVSKPARYTGNELNAVNKDHKLMKCSWALALPDVYEVGMSNLGLKILYQVLNDRDDTVAERVYAPWIDMEEKMRSEGLELWSLESFTPVKTFDFVGFSLQYEMIYTNILNMLALAKIPQQSAARGDSDPFIVGGGPCVYNPEPVAEFFDLFIIGEGEEVIEELTDSFIEWKMAQCPGGRTAFLRRAAQIEGIYVPSLYEVTYDGAKVTGVTPIVPEAKTLVYKRVIKDMDAVTFAEKPVVPYIDIVHDRLMLELFRGCTRGCRFCQAGMTYRPV